eukprot:CAMPEP_0175005162 /NCGR_PEP_ID=MMETSP0005-20121125/5160_1 /TAXON_ID=420556 /ORGANISM="Ochromonas sp., Strain CCMP1393" /LENGTH=427 /DNA_ID=CAMNT_0016260377 /DNA_START=137 /DNA_END=1420 /DNA_ORIENTATION=+
MAPSPQGETYRYLNFFERETGGFLMEINIDTATLYKGNPPIEHLRSRINEIIELNPWLEGRLIKQNGKIVLQYTHTRTPDANRASSCFQVIEENELPPESKVGRDTNHTWLTRYTVDKASRIIGTDKPLFLVSVVKLGGGRFALVVSIAHMLCDGHGFYQLYGMLSQNIPPRALNATRDHELHDEIKQKSGGAFRYITSVANICNIVGRMFFCNKAMYQARRINPQWVADQKHAFEARKGAALAPAFISTNDILTSNVLSNTKADVGLMAINFRNRIKNLTDDHFGNYEGTILFEAADYGSPELIRQSISDGRYKGMVTGDNPEPYPGFFNRMEANVMIVTNWAGLYQHIEFEGCEHIVHSPLYVENAPALVASILYMATATEMAIFVYDNTTTLLDACAEQGMVEAHGIPFPASAAVDVAETPISC